MPVASRIDPNYGNKCKPTFGENSDLPSYTRRVGKESQSVDRRLSTTQRPAQPAVQGRPRSEEDSYNHWCSFWGTNPTNLGAPTGAPDLSPSKELPDTMLVHNEEKQLRHDLDEDLRWFKNHNNKKPEKTELREQARRSHSMLELRAIEKGCHDDHLKRNFNRFGGAVGKKRPRRLEPFGSPIKMWTPRSRPKTPAPLEIRDRLGKQVVVKMPSSQDRDPANHPGRKDLKHQAFGFLNRPSKSELLVKDEKSAAEYDRFSNFKADRRTHWRKAHNPQECYGEPATTNMEFGWAATNPETYENICGPSPALHDMASGLPRISLAGGTPGRLQSEMSRFVDNVVMTRPGFNPF